MHFRNGSRDKLHEQRNPCILLWKTSTKLIAVLIGHCIAPCRWTRWRILKQTWLRTDGISLACPDLRWKKISWPVQLDRAKKKITLLQADMNNVIDHFSEQHAIFSNSLAYATSDGTSAEAKMESCIYQRRRRITRHSFASQSKTAATVTLRVNMKLKQTQKW